MPRLIDADAVLATIDNSRINYGTLFIMQSPLFDYAKSVINKAQTVDAEPVRHGHWHITDAYPHNVYCSECHTRFAQTHWAVWEDGSLPRNYCPHCGAKMDEVRDG